MNRWLKKYALIGAGAKALSPFRPGSKEAFRRAAWSALFSLRHWRNMRPDDADLHRIWLNRVFQFRRLAAVSPRQDDMERPRVIQGGVSGDRLTAADLGVGRFHDGKGF